MMDWFAAVFSLIGVYLTVKKHRVCWLVFLLSNALWITYCISNRQWAQLSLNVVFVILNVLGYRKWSRDESHQTVDQSTQVSLVGSNHPAQVQTTKRPRFSKGSAPFFHRQNKFGECASPYDLNQAPRPGRDYPIR